MNREELKAEYARKLELLDMSDAIAHLPGFKHIIDGKMPFAVFSPESKAGAAEVLQQLPPVLDSFEMAFAGRDSYTVESPYRIQVDSYAKPSPYTRAVTINGAHKTTWMYGCKSL